MANKRTILVEAALVVGVLATGIAAAGTVHAQTQSAPTQNSDVKIESTILIERTEKDASGGDVTKTYTPSQIQVVPGDKLVFINAYQNAAKTAFSGFVINNPVHPAVTFTDVDEKWALVSVDGGKTFGKLTDLVVQDKVTSEDGTENMIDRSALAKDVTHIRWAFAQPIAPGTSGELRFRGNVK